MTSALLALALFLAPGPLRAQDDPTPTGGSPLGFDLSAEGRVDSLNPRLIYSFDGVRGEFVSLRLRATSGDLDPMLLVIDGRGGLLVQRDDSQGTRDVVIESLRIPQTDRYYIVVSRFGDALGTTSGDFELALERVGVSSADGSGLRYGDTVLNEITDLMPRFYYTFRAARGDIVSIRMERTSGDLDPSLQLVDANGIVIAENDELEGSGSLDAAIVGHIIETDGIYVIIATRYGQVAGRSSGSFVLSLQSGVTGGLGRTVEVPIPLIPDQVYDNEITPARYEQFYRFEGRQFDLVSVEMRRTAGTLDGFLILTDDQQNPLITDDDGGSGQDAAIRRFALPYEGVFYIVATRFQRGSGTTSGSYTLTMRVEGNAFENVPTDIARMTYGSVANGVLDDLVPRVLYAMYGSQGDVITISLNRASGDLDPVVGLLDANQRLLISDDDSGGDQNARIERYTLPATGVYYIQAARFEGTDRAPTRGGFVLVLARRFD